MITLSQRHLLFGSLLFSHLSFGLNVYTVHLPENITAIKEVSSRASRLALMSGRDLNPGSGQYSLILNARLRQTVKENSKIQTSDMFPIYVNYKKPEKS